MYARGPMAALICQLLELKWQPRLPNSWIDQHDDSWNINDAPCDPVVLKQAIADTCAAVFWRKASSFYHGAGLESGADLVSESRHARRLRKLGRAEEAGMLTSIVTAGIWTASRSAASYGADPDGQRDLCLMCGEYPDTESHRYWSCPCLAQLDGIVAHTRHLCQQAREEAQSTPCLWLRGVLPTSMAPIDPPGPSLEFELGEAIGGGVPEWSVLHLDGSGTSSDPRLRRCGWAIAYVSTQAPYTFRGGWIGTLGIDDRQSVARAELTALVKAVANTRGPLLCYSDCLYVVFGFHSRIRHRSVGPHADLWHTLSTLLAARPFPVRVQWVKAHVNATTAKQHGLSPLQIVGNCVADALAKYAASLGDVPDWQKKRLDEMSRLATRIRSRMIAINMHYMKLPGFADVVKKHDDLQNQHPSDLP